MRIWNPKIALLLLLCHMLSAQAAIKVVAAENMYGELARQLGGKEVEVSSILSNPNQDPHLFSATPRVAKKLSQAQVIVVNGAGYDSWMDKLLAANKTDAQQVLNVASLVQAKAGANPHLWYQPQTMPVLAKAITDTYSNIDAKNQLFYQKQLLKFQQQYLALSHKIASLRQKYAGIPVLATEPVFEYMAAALGLNMLGQGLQQSIMNDVEPTPLQLKEAEDLLRNHQVKVLFYNKQVINPLTKHLQDLAHEQNIPVIGVTETQPQNTDYIGWMLAQLNSLSKALSHVAS
jgi:zinc/manganese transport system substrate-binding protein